MSVALEEQNGRPFRVPGYAGYVPGLKYLFGHTYGYDECRLFKSQHPNINKEEKVEKLTPCQPSFREVKSESCIERNGVHQKLSKVEESQVQQRKVQWTDGDAKLQTQQHGMETVESVHQQPLKNASIQCTIEEAWGKDEEREGLRSAATQWSDQEAHRKKKFSAGTQWSPADFSPLKTIPGYTAIELNVGTITAAIHNSNFRKKRSVMTTLQLFFQKQKMREEKFVVTIWNNGHLPGRHYVNPGKTFCQEIDALLTSFHPKSAAVVPISRHTFTSALQQMPNNKPEGKDDPYFDNRPPSTYLNNYPIPGYQGFVPRVRTSTSSLGIRYIKAVEKSLHALHEKIQHKKIEEEDDEEFANSPKKLLNRRPLHTPRHRPQPKHQPPQNEDDWRVIYKRPPSTYLDSSKTFIPGYKGFIPHLRGSPNAVGVRYSKAALRCVEKTLEKQGKSEVQLQKSQEKTEEESGKQLENQEDFDEINQQNSEMNGDQDNEGNIQQQSQPTKEDETEIEDQIHDYGDTGSDSDNGIEEKQSYATESNRLQRRMSEEKSYRMQHSDYLRDRKPSTYTSDERHPIPGYQGFIPRLRDSPTTLGLRYTKAAKKTLEDVHKNQQRTRER